MKKISQSLAVVAATSLLVACGGSSNSSSPAAKIRIHHGSPDAPRVDVSIDQSVALAGVDYYQSSDTIGVNSAQDYEVQIDGLLPGDETTTVIGPVSLSFEEDTVTEILAVNTVTAIEPVLVTKPYDFDETKVRVTVLHGAHSAPTVDVHVTAPEAELSSATVLGTFSFKDTLGPVEIDAGDYQIRVTAEGSTDALYDSGTLSFSAGSDLFVAALVNASDTGNEKSPIVLSVAANDNGAHIIYSTEDGSDVRVVHNSADAPAVDVIVNDDFDTPLVGGLSFPDFTDYVAVPNDDYNIKVVAESTTTAVIDADLSLDAGASYTVVATSLLESIEPLVLIDDTRKVATEAKVRIVHGSTLAGSVDIYVTEPGADITTLDATLSGVQFNDDTGYISLAAEEYDVTVTATGSKEAAIGPATINVSAGEIYTIIARDLVTLDGAGLTLLDGFNE